MVKIRFKDLLPKHKIIVNLKKGTMAHPVYSLKEIETIKVTHREPMKPRDWIALYSVKFLRRWFDFLTGYDENRQDLRKWLNRVIFLETIAGVPGMVGGMTMHLKSLATLRPDRGIIHHLL